MRYADLPLTHPHMRDAVQSEVRPGEKLIWSAQPIARYFTPATVISMIFAIPFTAISLTIVLGALGLGYAAGRNGGGIAASCFSLFGIPFVLVGLGLFTSPLWHRRAMKRTAYAITDWRAVVFQSSFFGTRTVLSFEPDRLTKIERRERADGSGDLIFEEFITRQGTGVSTTRRGFFSVANVREVEQILHNTLLKNRVRTVQT
ncbi:MAG TPA: hypothetical protein VGB55_10760 [Tepidisphaeraceae bacterium]|jgi:hypothetical protein